MDRVARTSALLALALLISACAVTVQALGEEEVSGVLGALQSAGQGGEDLWAAAQDGTANLFPHESTDDWLVGQGIATATRGGVSYPPCTSDSRIELIASLTPGTTDPNVYFQYGGANGDGDAVYPCLAGQYMMANGQEVTGDPFAGAWTAQKDFNGQNTWHLDVSSADPNGLRHVSFWYVGIDGANLLVGDTIEGTLIEAR
jgi:hypothetical protein